MTKTILVPLDGSQFAEQALGPAITLARASGARLLFVRSAAVNYMVIPEPIGYGYVLADNTPEARVAQAHDYLNGLHAAYEADDLSISTRVMEGDPATAILDAADVVKATLIVMTTHGYTGLTRWVLGSVASKVVRYANCPVLTLRSATPPRCLLLPLDGSPHSERAIDPALLVARAFGTAVVLMRADDDLVAPIEPRDAMSMERRESVLATTVQPGKQHRIELYLQDMAAVMQREGVRVTTVRSEGPAADAILREANGHDCDLIVMSTHGRTGVARWMLGSVTERVLSTCGRAMLVVR